MQAQPSAHPLGASLGLQWMEELACTATSSSFCCTPALAETFPQCLACHTCHTQTDGKGWRGVGGSIRLKTSL